MLERLLPRQIDATYRGQAAAAWFLAAIMSVKIMQSVLVLISGQYVVSAAEAIALDTYPPAAAQTIVFAFAGWKIDRLLIAIFCLLVLQRYRSLIPLMLSVFILQDVGRRLVAHFYPFPTIGTPTAMLVNLVLLVLAIIGLPLSLWETQSSTTRSKSSPQRLQ